MRHAQHNHRHGAGTVLAAFLALSFFASSPILFAHHHHANGDSDEHCAICLYVSVQVTPAHRPYDPTPRLITIGLVQTADETHVPVLPIRFDKERAPPSSA